MLPAEREIVEGRMPYEYAQRLLDGTVETEETDYFTCGWYGDTLHPDRGCYAVVATEGPLGDYVGDRLRLIYGQRTTIVYVFASSDIPYDIAITRRSYAALELLANEEIDIRFEVLRDE